MKIPNKLIATAFVLGIALGVYFGTSGLSLISPSVAKEAERGEPMISPVKARERDFYAPNSEDLGPDEIRVISCGTGMPTPRPAQAAACFLIELGNGDKFIFDIGDGGAERLFGLQIPTAFLDKVFIGHLHGDHFGDIGSLFVAGGIAGRFTPLRIWGPSGDKPELGTKAAIDAMEKMFAWDLAGRLGQTDVRGFTTEVHEFDYRKEQVVFDENGVVIRSFPAIHAIDGSVSYALEWNGMKIVFSSDTYPNKWFPKYAKDADLAIHECFIAVPDLVAKYNLTPEAALQVGTQIHTAPEAFGKIMSLPDDVMGQYLLLATEIPEPEVADIVDGLEDGSLHPGEVKRRLSREVVARYWGRAYFPVFTWSATHLAKRFRDPTI